MTSPHRNTNLARAEADRSWNAMTRRIIMRPGTHVTIAANDRTEADPTGTVQGQGWQWVGDIYTPYLLIQLDNPQWLSDKSMFISVIVAHPDNVRETEA